MQQTSAKRVENLTRLRARNWNLIIGSFALGRMLANGPKNLGSLPGRVIPMTLKIVLDNSLLNTPEHKVRIKGKVEQSREKNSALPYTSV